MAFKMNGFSAFTKQTGDKKEGKMWSKKQLLNMKKNLKVSSYPYPKMHNIYYKSKDLQMYYQEDLFKYA